MHGQQNINTVIPPDDRPGEVRNMYSLEIKFTKCTENVVHQVGFIYKII